MSQIYPHLDPQDFSPGKIFANSKTLKTKQLIQWTDSSWPYLCPPHAPSPTQLPQRRSLSWWRPGSPSAACLTSGSSAARPPAPSDTQPGPSSLAGPAAWPAGSQNPSHSPWWRRTCPGGGSPPASPGTSAGGSRGPRGLPGAATWQKPVLPSKKKGTFSRLKQVKVCLPAFLLFSSLPLIYLI